MKWQFAIATALSVSLVACQPKEQPIVSCAVDLEFQDEKWAEMGMYAVQGVCINEGEAAAQNIVTTVQVCNGSTILHEIPLAISELPPSSDYEIDLPFDSQILPPDVFGTAQLVAPYGSGCS